MVKMRREERMIAALQANPDPKTSMQRSNAERRLIEVMDSGMLDVTIASLEDLGSYSPSAEIWAEDKLPWVVLNPELPKYPQATN